MPTCADCGEYVTRDFVRVFGVDGEVHGCPDCTTYRELQDGGGVDRSSESRSPEAGVQRKPN
ncbi:hypothetical protein CV102_14020 [Natronococcus pandeyae]|uniref:Small CPxCG-related zinc finger protein n=1 Tax=Natronococcus pandeyae TaxID=2055836 RepID=A0A8J8Q203_9EURY|nr:hypothetical protein [Natronococcus pandeyae]TYL37847.1 hypothetical protein CV102_14020 [Natronococcus pandeyae]